MKQAIRETFRILSKLFGLWLVIAIMMTFAKFESLEVAYYSFGVALFITVIVTVRGEI